MSKEPDCYVLSWRYTDGSGYGIVAAYEVKEHAVTMLERFSSLCNDKMFELTPLSIE